jgi:hypothetical protein
MTFVLEGFVEKIGANWFLQIGYILLIVLRSNL